MTALNFPLVDIATVAILAVRVLVLVFRSDPG